MGYQPPAVKHKVPSEPRPIFRVSTPCYTRCVHRHKEIVPAPKPEALEHLGLIDQKAWEQYEAHLKRLSPLEEAEFYARQMEARRLRSQAALARLLGKPLNRLCRVLKLLDLPDPIKAFLREHRTPTYLRYFSEPKLTALLRLGDARTAWRRFQEMIAEADREAGVWRAQGSK